MSRNRTKLCVWLAGVTICATVAAVTWHAGIRATAADSSSTPSAASSRLVIDEPMYDFGQVDAGKAPHLRHEFHLKNPTNIPIRIVNQFATCGCTSVHLERTTVGPGDSVSVPVSVDWAGRNGGQAAQVTLTTDEVPAAAVAIRLTGRVENPVAVWPMELAFGAVDPGLTEPQFFNVSFSSPGKAIRILDIHATAPSVEVSRVTPIGGALDGSSGQFAVRVRVPRAAGTHRDAVSILTTHAATPIFVIISSRSMGAISAIPPSIVLDMRHGGDNAAATVRVRQIDPGGAHELSAVIAPGSQDLRLQLLKGQSFSEGAIRYTTLTVRSDGAVRPVTVAYLHLESDEDHLEIPITVLGP